MQLGPIYQSKITSFHSFQDEEGNSYTLTFRFNSSGDAMEFLNSCQNDEIISKNIIHSQAPLNCVLLIITDELSSEFVAQLALQCQKYQFRFTTQLLDPNYIDASSLGILHTPEGLQFAYNTPSNSDSEDYTSSDSENYNADEENDVCTTRFRTRSFP